MKHLRVPLPPAFPGSFITRNDPAVNENAHAQRPEHFQSPRWLEHNLTGPASITLRLRGRLLKHTVDVEGCLSLLCLCDELGTRPGCKLPHARRQLGSAGPPGDPAREKQ